MATTPDTAQACPAWCIRADHHDIHMGTPRMVGDVRVQLVQDPDWLRGIRIYLGFYLTLEDSAAVSLPPGEAADMAALLNHLGHRDLAAAIHAVAAAAEARP